MVKLISILSRFRKISLLLVVSLMLKGCGTPVLFNEEDSGYINDIVYSVYFDREGYIYPERLGENPVQIKTSEFSDGPGKSYLKRYFCNNHEQLKSFAKQAGIETLVDDKCQLHDDAKEGESGAISSGKWSDQWLNIQRGMLDMHAKRISGLLNMEGNADLPLFIFIHGYNNDVNSIRDAYSKARGIIRSQKDYKDKKFIFLDIYWDGHTQKIPFVIWLKAQYTGPLVGMHLRRMLKEISSTRKVRILTHSSGAFVVGNLIGDGRAPLPIVQERNVCPPESNQYDQAYCEYKKIMQSKITPEHYPLLKSKDVRVGMIAPATSSWTFTGGDKSSLETGRGLLKPSGKLRLIAGQHEDDYATTKGLGLECSMGVTALGVNKGSFCEIQHHLRNAKLDENIDVHRVDFKSDKEPFPVLGFRAEHGLKYYLMRSKAPVFLQLFLGDGIPDIPAYKYDNDCAGEVEKSC